MKYSVSVIIVSYNVRELLLNCLERLGSNGGSFPMEVILVDNASTDGTAEALADLKEKYGQWHLILNRKNTGFARACNQGAQIAAGEYLLFLNPDTVTEPRTIERMVDHLKTHPTAGVLGPKLVYSDGSRQLTCGPPLSIVHSISESFRLHNLSRRLFGGSHYMSWDHESPKEVGWVSGGCLLIEKKLFEELEGFDENFFIFTEDMDLCLRARKTGKQVLYWPCVQIVHLEAQSLRKARTVSLIRRYQGRLYYFKKHHGTVVSILHRFIFSAASFTESVVVLFLGMVKQDGEYFRILDAHLRACVNVWFLEIPGNRY